MSNVEGLFRQATTEYERGTRESVNRERWSLGKVDGGIRGPEIVYELVNASAGRRWIRKSIRMSKVGNRKVWMHGRGGTVSGDRALGRWMRDWTGW
jgi:hypothetical protein